MRTYRVHIDFWNEKGPLDIEVQADYFNIHKEILFFTKKDGGSIAAFRDWAFVRETTNEREN